jgi:hypothetical protein
MLSKKRKIKTHAKLKWELSVLFKLQELRKLQYVQSVVTGSCLIFVLVYCSKIKKMALYVLSIYIVPRPPHNSHCMIIILCLVYLRLRIY